MAGTGLKTVSLPLGGMTCGHCVATVEETLLGVDGVRSASADLASETALVAFDPSFTDPLAMERAVAAAGYAPQATSGLVSLGPTAPALASARPREASPRTSLNSRQLFIEGMTCASCVRSVENAALSVPGVAACDVSLADASARVRLDPATASLDDVIRAIGSAGYTAGEAGPASHPDIPDGEMSQLTRRLAVSATLTIPLLVLAMSHGKLHFQGSNWVQLLLALPVVAYGGAPFYMAAWTAARHGRSDMNTLIAIGTGAAFAYSVAATVVPFWMSSTGDPGIYFETSAAILTLVLLGRVLETRARRRTSASIRRLLELQAPSVRVRRGSQEQEIALEAVAVGDDVVIRPGERVPVDGTVLEGSGAVDESPITGESLPADKVPGSRIVSGSLNKDGFLVFRADCVGSDTALARIIDFVRQAQSSKAPAARLADRIAGVFVPAILTAAAVTFAVWMAAGPSDDRLRMALNNAVSVLIIACPCALGLATPTALAVGIGRAAENGILIRDGAALESARTVDTVAFDKTGTLTLGQFSVTDVATFGAVTKSRLLEACAAIERRSEHPIAKAIAAVRPGSAGEVADYRTLPGAGAEASFNGRQWLIGSPDLLAESGTDISAAEAVVDELSRHGKTVVLAAQDGQLAGTIALSDEMRPEAAAATASLRDRGIRTTLLSGDRAEAAKAVAAEAGIDEVLAPVMPIEKSDAIQNIQAEGRAVAMVGDGINDAPALAQADLGIAIGAGTDIAAESAGIVLVRSDPRDVVRAIDLAKRIQRTIVQNYWWAFGYNVLGVPIAAGILYPWAGILLSPIVASAAMALSSLSVVANSLRLRRTLPDSA